VGVVSRSSAPDLEGIEHLLDRIELRPADPLDQLLLVRRALQPARHVARSGLGWVADRGFREARGNDISPTAPCDK